MPNFFLQKNFAKPGETVVIQGDCIGAETVFSSSDENIAVVSSGTVNIVGVGQAIISETDVYMDCANGETGILLTATEDGNPFFMSKDDYVTFTNYEGIFVFFLLLSAFLIQFVKKT